MKIKRKIGILTVSMLALAAGIFWLMPESRLEKGMVIVTAVPGGIDLTVEDMGTDNRYITGSQIIALRMDEDDNKTEPVLLTEDFYSARAPEISYNGGKMVFSGQRNQNETWQIYTMDLKSFKVFQITFGKENCTDPAWLPDGRIAFSMQNEDKLTGPVH